VQGFMPSRARPEVDVLEELTTAIIVDHERMGANAPSTVGTVTDANALLRILFSRLDKPHITPDVIIRMTHVADTSGRGATCCSDWGSRGRGSRGCTTTDS
jgi:excinuclease UvrABC ATPase subunit